MKLLDELNLAGLPLPVEEHRFAPPRRWRFDYAWIERKIALEVEGGTWTEGRHVRGSGFIKDMEKYNEAALLGWTLIRVMPKAMKDGTAFRLVQRALLGKEAA